MEAWPPPPRATGTAGSAFGSWPWKPLTSTRWAGRAAAWCPSGPWGPCGDAQALDLEHPLSCLPETVSCRPHVSGAFTGRGFLVVCGGSCPCRGPQWCRGGWYHPSTRSADSLLLWLHGALVGPGLPLDIVNIRDILGSGQHLWRPPPDDRSSPSCDNHRCPQTWPSVPWDRATRVCSRGHCVVLPRGP